MVSHPSFLTHSSLLSLQVKDRNLRIQILTEVKLEFFVDFADKSLTGCKGEAKRRNTKV